MEKTNEQNKNQSIEQAKDPICGMTVNKATALHSERDGKTYYFCGSKCQQTFVTDAVDETQAEKGGSCCG